MEYYRHEIRAGAVVLGAGLILLLMLYFSADLAFWFQATKRVYVTYNNVSGLAKYDPVLYKGVKVGKVTNMEVLTEAAGIVLVSLDINADLPLHKSVRGGPRGSQFQIISTGLLGESAIEIIPGDPKAPALESEMVVPGREVVRLEDITYMVQEIATNVRDAMNTLTRTINDPETQRKFKTVLDSLSSTSEDLEKIVSGNVTNINDIMDNLNKTSRDLKATSVNLRGVSRDLNAMIRENRQQINTLVDNYKELPGRLESDMNKVQTGITSLIDENREQINGLVENLEKTSMHIEELAEDIKKHPYKIIRKTGSP
jgi:phospholipid/cholesterol/gamma-HCH transport system substrate-binding protein